jgi:hypothetical protein
VGARQSGSVSLDIRRRISRALRILTGKSEVLLQECGSPLVLSDSGKITEVVLGTVDGDPGVRPGEHIFAVLKLPGMRSSMHSQSMRNGPLMASRYRFSVLCIRRLSLFGRRAFSGSDIDTKGPAVTSRARASQVRLLSIIPLCSRMQRKIQRAGFRVRAQLLH